MKDFFKISKQKKAVIKEKIAALLREKKDISFAYLFGSFLDKYANFRDIDVAVFLKPIGFDQNNSLDYETKLSVELGRAIKFPFDKIDIKILNFAPPEFLNNVFSRGVILFSKDEKLLTDMIEKTSQLALENEYFSYLSFRELIS